MNPVKLLVILNLSVLILTSMQSGAQQPVNSSPALPSLPLAQRSQAQPIITDVIPAAEKKIKEATGAAIPFDIDWKSVSKSDGLTRLGGQIQAITSAIENIAGDPEGKKALAAKVKTIQINGTGLDKRETYQPHWSMFLKGSTLVLSVSVADQTVEPEEIRAALLKLL